MYFFMHILTSVLTWHVYRHVPWCMCWNIPGHVCMLSWCSVDALCDMYIGMYHYVCWHAPWLTCWCLLWPLCIVKFIDVYPDVMAIIKHVDIYYWHLCWHIWRCMMLKCIVKCVSWSVLTGVLWICWHVPCWVLTCIAACVDIYDDVLTCAALLQEELVRFDEGLTQNGADPTPVPDERCVHPTLTPNL